MHEGTGTLKPSNKCPSSFLHMLPTLLLLAKRMKASGSALCVYTLITQAALIKSYVPVENTGFHLLIVHSQTYHQKLVTLPDISARTDQILVCSSKHNQDAVGDSFSLGW